MGIRRKLNELVEQWGLQLVLYAFMWVLLFAAILVSFAVLGPRACAVPEPQVDPGFEDRRWVN